MVSSSSVLGFFLSLAVKASEEKAAPSGTQGLEWGPCGLNTTLPVQCAKLTVPLDYTNSTDTRTIDLDVIKYPAQKEPKRGSILLNFGGPGQDGLTSMLAYAEIQGPVTGGYHDLVSWDPRGTGKTLRFECWPLDITGTFAAMGNDMASSADTATGRLWAEGTIIADSCYSQLKDVGEYVGMAFTARDMMSIVDALGEDGMLRYWGISGGTTLGSTVVSMFPDRVDRVVLDGNMNVHQYYNSFGEPEMVESTDATWEQFMRGCVANPHNCALAHNRTYEELEATMLDLFATIREQPIGYNASIVLDTMFLKGHVFSSMYSPSTWPELATALDDLLAGNPDTMVKRAFENAFPSQAQAILGIRCGDKKKRTNNLADIEPDFEEYHRQSKWFWDFGWGYYVMPCAQWKFNAKERYEGDFNVKTKNPILFVGNTWDPVTPFASAKNMSKGFEGSVVLQHNGHGHLAMSQPSNCTDTAIQRYFLEGVLPEPGTVCEPNLPIFATAE